MSKKKNITTLDAFIDEQYGQRGASKREEFEQGYKAFKVGFLLHEARLKPACALSMAAFMDKIFVCSEILFIVSVTS